VRAVAGASQEPAIPAVSEIVADFSTETDDLIRRNEQFTQFRDHLWSLRQSNIEHADNLVLTLSAGILGLSISFVKDIVPIDRIVQLWELRTSWWAFSGSILFTLVSYWLARREMGVQETFAYNYYVENKPEYFEKRNYWKLATDACNSLASICFAAGVVLLVLFVSINLSAERHYLVSHEKTGVTTLH